MRILFVGDVVGQTGRRALRWGLRLLEAKHHPDLVVANGENSAGGNGLTPATVGEMFDAGCDVITTGNHVWDRGEIVPLLENEPRVLRPANYPPSTPGAGVCLVPARDGSQVAVVNLMGRVFMASVDDPFRTVDAILEEIAGRAQGVIVDFHAEATSEKAAFAHYVDGRVSAVVGTHTHVPTADERILGGGTAFITDVGMTGPYDSIIGVEKSAVIERFLTGRPNRFVAAEGDARMASVLIDVSPADGKATSVRRIELRESEGRESK